MYVLIEIRPLVYYFVCQFCFALNKALKIKFQFLSINIFTMICFEGFYNV